MYLSFIHGSVVVITGCALVQLVFAVVMEDKSEEKILQDSEILPVVRVVSTRRNTVELLHNAKPRRSYEFVFSIIFFASYLLFNAIYWFDLVHGHSKLQAKMSSCGEMYPHLCKTSEDSLK